MAQNTLKPVTTDRIQIGVAGALAILFILSVVYWGGVVRGPKLPAFMLGIAVLIATLCAFALAFWHLLIRPLPMRHRVVASQSINASYRQAIALLLGIASINIVVGGFWDEVWHRLYGSHSGRISSGDPIC